MLVDEIRNGESRFLEFKEYLPNPEILAKTVISFSNGGGGKIIIGVDDKRNITGVKDDIFDLKDKISNIIYERCYPNIIPEIYLETINKKKVMVVKIFPGNLKPYYLKKKGKINGVYLRIGASNRLADIENIVELERNRRNISFDEEENYEFRLDELDLSKLKKYFLDIQNIKITNEHLLSLKLIKKIENKLYPTNGLLIILGKFEHVRFKCAKFKGRTTEIFIDKKEFEGDIFEQLNNVEIFIKNHLNLGAKIEGYLRLEELEIPWNALREAILNAIVHRDYSKPGRDIKIAIFDDIVEITSPGVMPNSIKPEEAMKTGRSEIRNKVIARVFKKLGLIEEWGTGFEKMINMMNNRNLKFDFKEAGDFVQVIFYRDVTVNQEDVTVNQEDVTVNQEDVTVNQENVTVNQENVTVNQENVTVNHEDNILDKENIIIALMKENKKIKISEISSKLNLTERTIKRYIKKLKDKNKIKRTGSDKNGYWEIKSN